MSRARAGNALLGSPDIIPWVSCSSQAASQRPYDHLSPNGLDARAIVTLLLSFSSVMYTIEIQRLGTYTIAGSCRVVT